MSTPQEGATNGANGTTATMRKAKHYLPEALKHEAARQLRAGKVSVKKLAAKYSVHPTTLHDYVRKGYGQEPQEPARSRRARRAKPVAAAKRSVDELLMLAIRAALKEGLITKPEAVQLMALSD